MTIQHFQGVRSRCARMIRCTIASPIRFSILTSFTTVLHVHRAEYSHSAVRGVTYEVMKNWFSMYTKCSDI